MVTNNNMVNVIDCACADLYSNMISVIESNVAEAFDTIPNDNFMNLTNQFINIVFISLLLFAALSPLSDLQHVLPHVIFFRLNVNSNGNGVCIFNQFNHI